MQEEIYGNTLRQFLADLTADRNFRSQNFFSNGSIYNFSQQSRRLLLGSFIVIYILIT